MNVPEVKLIDDNVVITLDKRQAELLGMFLGTLSCDRFRTTINNYYSRYSEGNRPKLCSPHQDVSIPTWRTQDSMVSSHIYNGISEALKWDDIYYNNTEEID